MKNHAFTQDKNPLSFPKAVIGNLSFRKRQDPRYRLSGMTSGGTPGMTRAHAFTLIELLVVVLIIGILAAVALPQYQKAVIKSRFSTVFNVVRAIADAQEVYHLANNSYTTNTDDLGIDISGAERTVPPGGGWEILDWGNGMYRVVVEPTLVSGAVMQDGKYYVQYQYQYSKVIRCVAWDIGGDIAKGICAGMGGTKLTNACRDGNGQTCTFYSL